MFDIPGFGDEIATALGLVGEAVHSHSGRAARTVLEKLPRDLVLELSATEVASLVREIVGLQERRVVRVFEVPEPAGRWTTVLVYFPRRRFNAELPERLADMVADAYDADRRTFESLVSASSLARVTVSVRRSSADRRVDLGELERVIDEQSISWTERLRAALVLERGEAQGHRLFDLAGASAPPAYSAAVVPERAVADLIARVDEVLAGDDDLVVALGHDPDAHPDEWRIRVYRRGTAMALSELLPLLDHLGFVALDEQPYTFRIGAEHACISTTSGCGCQRACSTSVAVVTSSKRSSVWSAGPSKATASTGSSWSPGWTPVTCAMIRSYAKYLRQIGFAFSQQYIENTLARHPQLAGQLVELFTARFEPVESGGPGSRDAAQQVLREQIVSALDAIPSLDEDRICRSFLTLIEATTRTTFFRRETALAFKFDPAAIPDFTRATPGLRDLGVQPTGGREFISAAVRWHAAGCAGATAERTSGPRCSG